MATAAEVQTILDGAVCYECKLPGYLAWYGVLAALIDIGNGATVPAPDALILETQCLQCIPPGMLPYALIAAARNLAGGGGSGSVLSGAGAPVADPGVSAAIYFDTATGVQYDWYGSPGSWH